MNFHCPRCFLKPDVRKKCRFDAETRARIEEELRVQARLEKEKEGRSQADELAGAVFEFFKSLYSDDSHDDDGPSITHQEIVDLVHQNALSATPHHVPSSDSITVTTVFGVHEEPSNVTIISGPTAAMQHQSYSAEIEDVYGTDHIEQMLQEDDYTFSESDIDALLAGGIVAPNVGAHMDLDTDSAMNDEGEDADIDTDDFDAESAVIDEFIDDGGLTPTATTLATNI